MTNPLNAPAQLTKSGRTDLQVILGSPSHDALTEYMSMLLDDFPPLGFPTSLFRFVAPKDYGNALAHLSIESDQDVFLIFCGHGSDAALLGPGTTPNAADYGTLKSVFYDRSHLHLGPQLLLAFCCSAGIELADVFGRFTSDGIFVGYDDKLYLVMGSGPYAECWRRVLFNIAIAILTTQNDRGLEQAIKSAYAAALSEFPPSKDSENEWGLLMRAYIRKQMETVTFVRT